MCALVAFSVAVTKCRDPGNLWKERFVCEEESVVMGSTAAGVDRSRKRRAFFFTGKHEAEKEMEAVPSFKLLKPVPRDFFLQQDLPPVLLQRVPPAGN